MVWPGDTVVCKGRVTDRHGEQGRYFAELDLWAENQRGELLMKGNSQIQLFYSVEDETRQRAGQPPMIVNVPRESILQAPAPEAQKPAESGSKKIASSSKPSAKKAAVPAKAKPKPGSKRK